MWHIILFRFLVVKNIWIQIDRIMQFKGMHYCYCGVGEAAVHLRTELSVGTLCWSCSAVLGHVRRLLRGGQRQVFQSLCTCCRQFQTFTLSLCYRPHGSSCPVASNTDTHPVNPDSLSLTDCLTVSLFQVLTHHLQHVAWRSGHAGVALVDRVAHEHLPCDSNVDGSVWDGAYSDPGVFEQLGRRHAIRRIHIQKTGQYLFGCGGRRFTLLWNTRKHLLGFYLFNIRCYLHRWPWPRHFE